MIKVLYCASEATPFAKTGGLADVAGALPQFIKAEGIDIRIVLPFYKKLINRQCSMNEIGRNVFRCWEANMPVYFIDLPEYFNREGIYGDAKGDYPDNLERFIGFCKGAIDVIHHADFVPDIIHCNDWQTALIPLYIADRARADRSRPYIYMPYTYIKTILTIHNMGYQGIFEMGQFDKIGLGKEFFASNAFEYHGKINLLKAGILCSDIITAVSPTYAQEIQTQELGFGLEKELKEKGGDLFGILNGIYNVEWDPAKDKAIECNYCVENFTMRGSNHTFLQKTCGLDICDRPLAGMVGRLIEQKGLDILIPAIPQIIKMGWQVVLLGTGMQHYCEELSNLAKLYRTSFFIALKFDDIFARQIYAGADAFLVPSKYEPCGISQMIAMRYGCVPVVRRTGGLADTVQDVSDGGGGFVFNEYDTGRFIECMQRARDAYQDKGKWNSLIKLNMAKNFSWEYSAKEYVKIYKKMVNRQTEEVVL